MQQIGIHKKDHEGAFHIDALTGQITTPIDERPDWADGYVVASLGERVGWYEVRLGQQLPDSIRKPSLIDASDLTWIALDAEGEEVEVEADDSFRMNVLAELLNIDLEDPDGVSKMEGALVTSEATHNYSLNPSDEETLEAAEGLDFSEVAEKRKATN